MSTLRAPPGWMFIGMYLVPKRTGPTIGQIQAAVARHYGIPLSEMTSQRRERRIARPRQVAMCVAKRCTPRSLPVIARMFGGRDHTTVIFAVKAVEARRAKDPVIDRDVRTFLSRFGGTL